ncbi:c-type cytochrome [Limnohabitans radicicola]|uniref:C-type cytochrome n=1 Tax=Limnohabitans radicicola TaxID=2771427 RepID=A0A927FED5_9BURK|nr:c-type cytochrome [Limnohabitans radicicola]MBD8049860.1 c-type cytochrome [Limnohabitans radicicola]
MKTLRTLAAVLMALGMMGLAHAADGETLLKDSGCLSCHAKAEKVVGPAFLSVADKYRGDKDAVATLVQSIQNGSKGKWGRMPMPPHASISPDDLKTLARHVLATKP